MARMLHAVTAEEETTTDVEQAVEITDGVEEETKPLKKYLYSLDFIQFETEVKIVSFGVDQNDAYESMCEVIEALGRDDFNVEEVKELKI